MKKKILVVGDAMLDVSYFGEVHRISPEAPIPVFEELSRELYAGGAANVAMNIAAMGGDVTLLAPIGGHRWEYELQKILGRSEVVGIKPSLQFGGLTVKFRHYVGRHMLFRHDKDYMLNEEEQEAVLACVRLHIAKYDYLVVCDYGKGATGHAEEMLNLARKQGAMSIVDPKHRDWLQFHEAAYIKCNAAEYDAAGDTVPGGPITIVTEGASGSYVRYPETQILPARANSVDPTGAGDSYLAAMVVGLSCGLPLRDALNFASRAGAIAVSHMGTHVVTSEEL